MRLTDVVRHRRAVVVNLHPAAHITQVHHLLRVTQPVRVDDLHGGGVASLAVPQPVGPVLQVRQRIAVNQLVPERQAKHLRHRQLTLHIAPVPRIHRPAAPGRFQRPFVFLGPGNIKRLVAADPRQLPVIRTQHRPE
ncbi:hypothetical protein D3C87_1438390 [compost metagenome]